MLNFYLYRKAWRFDGAPHEEQALRKEEIKALLKQGGLMVRNTYDFEKTTKTHFWYVIKDKFDGAEELSSRDRNKVVHAFRTFDYRRISVETLEEKVFDILKETFEDYPVKDRKMNHTIFQDYLDECKQHDFDYWGIFDKKSQQLVGFCTVKLWKRCCEYGYTGILTKYKRNATYPYYGLFHSLNQFYLQENEFMYVSDSARSITNHSQIQDFLEQHFGFHKAYCQLEIHYQWWMKWAVNILYPFRKIITIPSVKAVLNMESMCRSQK